MSFNFLYEKKPFYKNVYFKCFCILIGLTYSIHVEAITNLEKIDTPHSLLKIFNVPKRNANFIGRQPFLKNIQAEFSNNRFYHLSLTGLSGLGKTQLAKEYIYRYRKKYKLIWWFDCSSSLTSQFIEFARRWNASFNEDGLKIPEASITPIGVTNAVKTILEKTDKNWFLIFDNIPQGLNVNDYIPKGKVGSKALKHLLCTSKYNREDLNSIKLKKFNSKESLLLLEKILGERNKTQYQELAIHLDGMPLALTRAAFYIKKVPSMNIKDYLILHKNKINMLEKLAIHITGLEELTDYQRSFSSALEISIEELKRSSPIAYECLLFLAFLHNKNITNQNIQDWLKINNYPEEALHEITYNLVDRFLIEPLNDSNPVTKYEMHQLTQKAIRDTLKQDKVVQIIEKIIRTFSEYIGEETYLIAENLSHNEHLEDHLKEISEHIIHYKIKNVSALEFMINLFHASQFYINDQAFSHSLVQYIEENIKTYPHLSKFSVARYLNTRGKHFFSEDLNHSIELTLNAINILEKLDKSKKVEAEKFLGKINNLVDYYLIQGDIRKATQLCKEFKETINFLNHNLYTTVYYSFLALCEMYEGKYEEALKSIENSLDAMKKGNLSEYLFIFVKVNKAEILARMDKLEDCSKFLTPLQKDLFDVFQTPLNHLIIRTKIIKSLMELKEGALEKSKHTAKGALKEYQELTNSPMKDPLQGFGHTILGDVYFKEGNFQKSLNEYMAAKKVYDKVLVIKEIDDLSDLYTKIALTSIECNDFSTCKEYFNLQLKGFGLEHKRTIQLVSQMDQLHIPVPW